MRIFMLSVSLALVLLLAGCSGDDGVSPTPEPPVPPIVSGTIGTDGGELRNDEIVLTVPAGALTEDTELKIFDESDSVPFGQPELPVYAIEGLPENLETAVGVRFKHRAAKDAETSLFLGEHREARSVGRELFWELTTSVDSSGWCLTQLERGPLQFGGKAEDKLRLAVAEGLVATAPSAHFRVYYLESDFDAERAEWSRDMLEEAFDNLYDLGFHFGEQDTIWPLNAYMVQPEASVAAYVNGSYGKGFFRFPPHSGEPNNFLKAIYMHETFHLAQMWFDTRPPREWFRLNTNRTWLDEATASWSERYFYPFQFWPLSMDHENYVAPLAGVAGHPTLRANQYGYGMASFIKYLVAEQNAEAVYDIYVEFALHNQSVVEAFQAALDPPLPQWCLSFQQDLIGDEIYDPPLGLDPVIGYFVPPTPMPRGVGDSYCLNLEVRDFGSDGEAIELQPAADGQEEADALRLRVNGGYVLSAFLSNLNDPPTLITSGVDSLTIGDLSEIQDGHNFILALATKDWSTDPYWSSTVEVPVEVEMLPPNDLAGYLYGQLYAQTQVVWAGGGEESRGLVIDPPSAATVGHWTGSEFNLEWDEVDDLTTDSGFITFTIDPETLDIINFSGQLFYYQSDVDVERFYEISGGPVPLLSLEDDVATWRVEGNATCNTLTSRYQRETEGGVVTRETTDFGCVDSGEFMSYLEISLMAPY